ncbi:hypothetical protein CBM2634_U50004 [Cupriavidus taiwanensis]|uniref:Uncharacterized protein n=1 Tax=Cupriavidus taiwanensis TaxID=164546 RepID=A0A375JCT3_9BURK|nr:hypothetical protein CBM2634_U50004 [Cupriavidus taiwanensis]
MGRWELLRIAKPGDKSEQWILFKKRNARARPLSEFDVLAALPDSVIAKPLSPPDEDTGPVMEEAPDSAVRRTPRVRLPAKLAPQLATLSSTLPSGSNWIIETKFK